MARSTEITLSRERVRDRSDGESEGRWPVLHTALFALAASAGLWAMLITGVRWLVG